VGSQRRKGSIRTHFVPAVWVPARHGCIRTGLLRDATPVITLVTASSAFAVASSWCNVCKRGEPLPSVAVSPIGNNSSCGRPISRLRDIARQHRQAKLRASNRGDGQNPRGRRGAQRPACVYSWARAARAGNLPALHLPGGLAAALDSLTVVAAAGADQHELPT